MGVRFPPWALEADSRRTASLAAPAGAHGHTTAAPLRPRIRLALLATRPLVSRAPHSPAHPYPRYLPPMNDDVRRCVKCHEPSVTLVMQWKHTYGGFDSNTSTLEYRCQSCGYRVLHLPKDHLHHLHHHRRL